MAKYARVVGFSISPRPYKDKPINMSFVEYEREWLEKHIAQVLSYKPDLIVLPENCDRPRDMPMEEVLSYYDERKDKILDYLRGVAKKSSCYIAYSTTRVLMDGTRRNSCQMIDRNGRGIGCYDKNYLVETEPCLHGERETVFECDFGRVGVVICFDLNFEEMRKKYKATGVDLMIFPSNFGGGLMKNFFAFDTRSYFLSSCGYECPAELITPLGNTVKKTTNHYNYFVEDINLDFVVCHLDFNWEKIRMAKEKYGDRIKIHDLGYIGVVMLSSETEETTAKEIVKEFGIKTVDEYLDRAREQRNVYLKKRKESKNANGISLVR